MPVPTVRLLALAPALALALAGGCGRDDPPPRRVLDPRAAAAVLDALQSRPGTDPAVPVPSAVSQDRSTLRLSFPVGREVVVLTLSDPGDGCDGGLVSGGYCIFAGSGGPASGALAAAVARRLDAIAPPPWISPVPSPDPGAPDVRVHGGWFVVAAAAWLALLLSYVVRVPGIARRFDIGPVATHAVLATAAAAVRLAFATWGPGDLVAPEFNNLFAGGESRLYGVGPDPLFLPLIRLAGAGDRVVIATNLVLSSLCPSLLLTLLLRLRSVPRTAAAGAAIALAFLPLPLRAAGEFNRVTLVVFLSLVATSAFAALPRATRSGFAAAAVRLVSATLLASMTRPEGALVLVPLALLALSVPAGPGRTRSRLAAAAAAALAAAYGISFLVPNPIVRMYQARPYDLGHRVLASLSPWHQSWLDPSFTPAAVLLLAVLGAAFAIRRRDASIAWAAFALPCLGALYMEMPTGMDGTVQLASARYQALAAVPLSVLAGSGLARLVPAVPPFAWPRPRSAWFVAAALALATFVPSVSRVLGPTDIDREYALLRAWIPELPSGAEIHCVHGARGHRTVPDVALRPPEFLSALVGRPDVTWHEWPFDPGRPDRPRFLLYPAVCSEVPVLLRDRREPGLDEVAAACREAAESVGTPPFRSARIPWRRFLDARPRDGSIPIALYPLVGGTTADPGAGLSGASR